MGEVKLLPCPFCGYEKARIMYAEGNFLGQTYNGVKKIRFKAYGVCNKCHSRGKPVFLVVDDVHTRGWLARMRAILEPMAAEEWNRRAENG